VTPHEGRHGRGTRGGRGGRRGARRPRVRRRAVRRHGFLWGVTRVLGACLMAAMVLAAVGTGYQRLAAERDARRHPPPGRMVTVLGHPMHLDCRGEGEPTVILDGGLGEWSLHWRAVQARLAETTRTCAYDRPGYGWSAPGPPPRDGRQRAEELHLLLKNGEVVPPYVLVGHGTAGFHLRAYAAAHPEWVQGLALVDTVPADAAELYERVTAPVLQRLRQAMPAAQFGLLRFTGPPPGLGPRPPGPGYRRQAVRPAFYETYLEEAGHLLEDADRAAAIPLSPGLPLTVVANDAPLSPKARVPQGLAAAQYDRAWARSQDRLAALSVRAERVALDAPGANLLLADPGAVAAAVERLVATARRAP